MTSTKDAAGLDRSLIHGVAWTGGAKWAAQLFSWIATIAVARMLSPADYGLVGMASLYLGVVTTLSELGLGSSVLRHQELTQRQLHQLQALSLLLGIAGFAVTGLAAAPLASLFDAPALRMVVIALGVKFVITGGTVVPLALLQRRLAYRRIAIIETVQGALTSGLMVASALAGYGYWSLVIGNLAGTVVRTVLLTAAQPVGWQRPRWRELAGVVTFGADVLGARLMWYIYSNADFFVVGKFLGRDALGAYGFGWAMASMPVEKVSALVGRVTPGIFAAAQKDPEALRRYLLRITEVLAIVTFPAAVGLALVAPDFVRLTLGDKWAAAAVPLQLLALYIPLRSIVPLVGQLLVMIGEARLGMWNAVLQVLVLPPSFYIGSRWGVEGVAVAWLLVYPFTVLPTYARVFQRISLRVIDYLACLRPAFTGTVLMTGAVLLTRLAIPDTAPIALRFGLEVSAGVLGFGGAMLVLHRDRLTRMISFIRDRA
jgi:O-antigen/teichoic acid export membrane protein